MQGCLTKSGFITIPSGADDAMTVLSIYCLIFDNTHYLITLIGALIALFREGGKQG